MLEFTLNLGPLHLTFRLTDPTAGDEYVELTTDTELETDDDQDPDAEVGFRGP